MFSVRLYLHILVYVWLIVLVMGLGLAGMVSGRVVIWGAVAVLAALGLIGRLVHYLNSCNRRMKLFFDSIEDDESMLYFPESMGTREQRYLHATFNRIYTLMAEHKKHEFERKLRQKEYESWEKLMRVLTHEIMNSITPVVSLSETLLSYFRTKEGTARNVREMSELTIGKTIRALETIRNQGRNLLCFTDSYRQFACLKQPECSSFSLTDLLQDIQILYREDLARQHIGFSVDCPQFGIQVHADEGMLSQVLINLLKNSMQALAGQSDKKIHVVAYCKERTLSINVTDNGPGIPSDLAEDIFIPFFTTKPDGNGIGLSLSRQIVRMHGGELSVSSQPYHKTTFTISLPWSASRDAFHD